MLKEIRADLHVHTCLSPCGDLKMTPQRIVMKALEEKIDVIAISDHNSAENVSAVARAAEGKNLLVLPGMEVCTVEEVHVLALFDNMKSAFMLQERVYAGIHGKNDADLFGIQVVANEADEVEKINDRLLISAADISIGQVVDAIHDLGGLAIASHIDRESYSVVSQLGFVPDTVRFDGIEISACMTIPEARRKFPEYAGYPFVQNSDAHFPGDIGKRTTRFLVDDISFGEIKKGMRSEEGRKVIG